MALANAAAAAGRDVVLWGRDSEAMAALGATRLSDKLPGVRLTERVVVDRRPRRARGLSGDSGRDARSGDPRRGRCGSPRFPDRRRSWPAPRAIERGSHAFMTRGACSRRAGPPGCDPLRSVVRRRRRRRPADRGDARRGRRGARPLALPPSAWTQPQALSRDRRPRRRDRRRRQERARDRLRRRRRTRPRRQRGRGAGRPRVSPNYVGSATPSARAARP